MNININNLFIFIEQNQNDKVKSFLLDNGIEIKDEFGKTALHNTSFYNNTELLDWLLNNGSDINMQDNNGYTALHFAVQEVHDEIVKILLKNNVNLDIQDINGNTASWVCVMHWKGGKNLINLKELYKKGADFSIKNNAGRSTQDIVPEKIMNELKY